MILATASNVSNPEFVDSLNQSRQGASQKGASPLKLAKTVGVLALALSGGARSAQAAGVEGNRRLMEVAYDEVKPRPYDYGSVCDDGLSTPYVQGTNYEDCMAAEKAQIDTIRQSKDQRLGQLKRCYTISGYLAAALFGSTVVGLGAGPSIDSEAAKALIAASSATNFCLGFAAIIPTTVCGAMYSNIKARFSDSRAKAEECCKVFPTQEELAAFAAASANQTFADAPAPVNVNVTR
jgi:hypothetical protein